MYRVGGVEMSGKGRDSIETLLKSNRNPTLESPGDTVETLQESRNIIKNIMAIPERCHRNPIKNTKATKGNPIEIP